MRWREKQLQDANTEHALVSYNALDTKDFNGEKIIAIRNEDSVDDL